MEVSTNDWIDLKARIHALTTDLRACRKALEDEQKKVLMFLEENQDLRSQRDNLYPEFDLIKVECANLRSDVRSRDRSG